VCLSGGFALDGREPEVGQLIGRPPVRKGFRRFADNQRAANRDECGTDLGGGRRCGKATCRGQHERLAQIGPSSEDLGSILCDDDSGPHIQTRQSPTEERRPPARAFHQHTGRGRPAQRQHQAGHSAPAAKVAPTNRHMAQCGVGNGHEALRMLDVPFDRARTEEPEVSCLSEDRVEL